MLHVVGEDRRGDSHRRGFDYPAAQARRVRLSLRVDVGRGDTLERLADTRRRVYPVTVRALAL